MNKLIIILWIFSVFQGLNSLFCHCPMFRLLSIRPFSRGKRRTRRFPFAFLFSHINIQPKETPARRIYLGFTVWTFRQISKFTYNKFSLFPPLPYKCGISHLAAGIRGRKLTVVQLLSFIAQTTASSWRGWQLASKLASGVSCRLKADDVFAAPHELCRIQLPFKKLNIIASEK